MRRIFERLTLAAVAQLLELGANCAAIANDVLDALPNQFGLRRREQRLFEAVRHKVRRSLVLIERIPEPCLYQLGLLRVVSTCLPHRFDRGLRVDEERNNEWNSATVLRHGSRLALALGEH